MGLRRAVSRLLVIAACLLAAACARREGPAVESLAGAVDTSRLGLSSLTGVRDGDRLDVRALYRDTSRELLLELHFTVGVPTRLSSGTWTGLASSGTVRERSSTFLGGQSGPPSLGGHFDLAGPDGSILYRVHIPLHRLNRRE